jgi:hypothetical protein
MLNRTVGVSNGPFVAAVVRITNYVDAGLSDAIAAHKVHWDFVNHRDWLAVAELIAVKIEAALLWCFPSFHFEMIIGDSPVRYRGEGLFRIVSRVASRADFDPVIGYAISALRAVENAAAEHHCY